MNLNAAFQWKCQPQAENFILGVVDQAAQADPMIKRLKEDMESKTSTRLFDWLDHVVVDSAPETLQALRQFGFVLQLSEADRHIYFHPGAQLPKVVVKNLKNDVVELAVSVEAIADFLMVRGGLDSEVEGVPFGGYRRCCASSFQGSRLWVVERRGVLTMEPTSEQAGYVEKYLLAKEKWQNRPRALEDENLAMRQALSLAKELIETLGQDRAAWIVLEVERAYWQARNAAGQLQKNRQDRLGMGWANHDHHTFRSSRKYFTQLVRLFESLGFYCRERFYAGEEAGWGAQVMENPNCRLVLFLDVDLAAGEIQEDFAHQPLPELSELGSIGLWCALHGDSILKAGMHHLEAQFMFEELTQDLSEAGVKMMNPFSSFPYLKQAFTVGEQWEVDSKRVQKLVEEHKINQEQAQKFLSQGALGSHLENLQRREGYKGFNQKNVSLIIKKTDPRL